MSVIVSASDKPGRRYGLRADDRAVWEAVTTSITPLKRRRSEARPSSAMADEIVAPAANRHPVASQPAKSAASVPPPLTPVARRAKQKLARGVQAIDGRLDLHGLTQGEAHLALTRFLRRAQASGARFVLVITGKGARSDPGAEGVLKRQVPMWLQRPDLRHYVVGFSAAHSGHGGEGALYVQVRRGRQSTRPPAP